MIINRLRLEFAAENFLAAMRRQYFARPGADPALAPRTLAGYSESDRGALMKAMEAAVEAASPEADKRYNSWLQERMNNHAQQAS